MKKLLILTSAILLLAAACNKQASVQPAQNNITATDQTVNWKTYSNNQHGFEIKYPNDYEVLESKDQGAALLTIYPKVSPQVTTNGVGIQIVVIPNTTVDSYADKIISNANIAFSENNLQVYEARLGDQTAVKTVSYVTVKNGPTTIDNLIQKGSNIYEFRFLETSSDSIESKIFHTFKFTK